MTEFSKELEFAKELAKIGGEIILEEWKSVEIHSKGVRDVVTDADIKSEELIINRIRKEFPSHSIWTEERDEIVEDSNYWWIIDPLDGTRNYSAGIPYFSTSVALKYKDDVVLGVVYNPCTKELYFAEKGEGAFLNGGKLSVSPLAPIKDSIILCDWDTHTDKKVEQGLNYLKRLIFNARVVLVNFSPALDLCGVAQGLVTAFISNGTLYEDHAAGSLIVHEAGGIISNYSSKNWNVKKTGIIATSSEQMAEKIDELLRGL